MVLKWRNGAWHYNITVTSRNSDGTEKTQVYETYKVICDAANNIRGRATRVYEAHIADPEKKHILSRRAVIKDSWVDVGRTKEGDTLFELLQGSTPEERGLFLTVLQHGVVQIDGCDDTTQDLILAGQTFFENKETRPKKRDSFFRTKLQQRDEGDSGSSTHSDDEPAYNTPLFPLFHPESPSNNSLPNQDHDTPAAVAASHQSSASRASSSAARASSIPPAAPTNALSHHTPYEAKRPIIYSPKVHYRIVFREVAVSLLSMASSGRLKISHVQRAMVDTTLGKHEF